MPLIDEVFNMITDTGFVYADEIEELGSVKPRDIIYKLRNEGLNIRTDTDDIGDTRWSLI